MEDKLGCGKITKTGQLCGIANAWGKEYLCTECDQKLKNSWDKEMDEAIGRLKSLLIEDLMKECNRDIVLVIGGVRFTHEWAYETNRGHLSKER